MHEDTLEHWRRLVEHSRCAKGEPKGEAVLDLIAQLESELAQASSGRR